MRKPLFFVLLVMACSLVAVFYNSVSESATCTPLPPFLENIERVCLLPGYTLVMCTEIEPVTAVAISNMGKSEGSLYPEASVNYSGYFPATEIPVRKFRNGGILVMDLKFWDQEKILATEKLDMGQEISNCQERN